MMAVEQFFFFGWCSPSCRRLSLNWLLNQFMYAYQSVPLGEHTCENFRLLKNWKWRRIFECVRRNYGKLVGRSVRRFSLKIIACKFNNSCRCVWRTPFDCVESTLSARPVCGRSELVNKKKWNSKSHKVFVVSLRLSVLMDVSVRRRIHLFRCLFSALTTFKAGKWELAHEWKQ